MTIKAMALLLVASPSTATETEHLQSLKDAEYALLNSKTIGRDFHVYVKLPSNYADNPDKSYPTVYLLDGGNLFPMLVAYQRYLTWGEESVDAIIVGIAYGSDAFTGGNNRSTDFTAPTEEREFWGGAGDFQTFLSDELIPYVEASYRSDATRRIVFGHSLGGQFVLYSAQTRPNLFWGHIASNPALHRNLPFFLQSHTRTETAGELSRLFVASAEFDDPRFRGPALEWIAHWSAVEVPPWQLKTITLDDHKHFSSVPAAFRQGMDWLAGDL